MLIQGIQVTADANLAEEEINTVVEQEIALWKTQGKVLGKVELSLEGDEIIINACEKSPIRRVRRITGYLSGLSNFNQAKRAECCSRSTHA
ncbi:MAG: hypothetical protein H6Q75_884 [Firmicutes bacterium]|nr:hypothetical protein [Bacillota bacterium]